MPKIGQGGILVGDDNQPILVNGEQIKVDIEDQIKDRLERQRAQLTRDVAAKDDQIKALQAQSSRTPELERMLVDLQAQKRELESAAAETATKLKEAETAAEQRVASQVAQFKTEAETAKQALEAERTARLRESLANQILGAAKDKFNDPALDVVPHLLGAHKREPELGADGKPIDGKFRDLFEVEYSKPDGTKVREQLPADKALDVWAQTHPHHVRSSGGSGSGGGHYTPVSGGNRSKMSDPDKIAFIKQHGQDAYLALPS